VRQEDLQIRPVLSLASLPNHCDADDVGTHCPSAQELLRSAEIRGQSPDNNRLLRIYTYLCCILCLGLFVVGAIRHLDLRASQDCEDAIHDLGQGSCSKSLQSALRCDYQASKVLLTFEPHNWFPTRSSPVGLDGSSLAGRDDCSHIPRTFPGLPYPPHRWRDMTSFERASLLSLSKLFSMLASNDNVALARSAFI
jgi:hypothetical protein